MTMFDHQHHRTSPRPPRTSTATTAVPVPAVQQRRDAASKGSVGLMRNSNSGHRGGGHQKQRDADSIVTTPSSVHLHQQYSLTRDLSDLSGSYAEAKSSSNNNNRQMVVPASNKSWRHAQILSSRRLPQHPQPPADDESSVGVRGGGGGASSSKRQHQRHSINNLTIKNSHSTTSVLDDCEHDAIEVLQVVNGATAAAAAMSTKNQSDGRTPLLLLLMDTNRKSYELMQIWMDVMQDSVRDILQAVTRNTLNWRQDYDGFFQVRNNHFSQLIHVLAVAKNYQVVPFEVWVCKPWSMSAKATVGHASTLLNHLKQLGVLEYKRASEFRKHTHGSKWKQLMGNHHSTSHRHNDDTVLVLSKQAQQRVYVPEGILKHHHACQFLSFAPPFETDHVNKNVADVPEQQQSSTDDAASALSDSNYYEEEHEQQRSLHSSNITNRSQREEAPIDSEEETESTFSTTGTNSPVVSRPAKKLHSNDDAGSAVTRESSYRLKASSSYNNRNRPLAHVLPSAATAASTLSHRSQSQSRGGFTRLLSALSCAKSANGQVVLAMGDELRHFPPDLPLSRIWEESDAMSQSSGAPLLSPTRAPTNVDWRQEIQALEDEEADGAC
jgi:hypothetical protein